ncbi:hypothetical protein WK17_00455 [Burkholderia multivorans]|nr:hypothetical protein WK17_00455 [Burkholderia multivorans]
MGGQIVDESARGNAVIKVVGQRNRVFGLRNGVVSKTSAEFPDGNPAALRDAKDPGAYFFHYADNLASWNIRQFRLYLILALDD